MINYHLIVFADLVIDRRTLSLMGTSAIVTIFVCLSCNFGYIFFNKIREAIKKIRIKYYTWKRNNLFAK